MAHHIASQKHRAHYTGGTVLAHFPRLGCYSAHGACPGPAAISAGWRWNGGGHYAASRDSTRRDRAGHRTRAGAIPPYFRSPPLSSVFLRFVRSRSHHGHPARSRRAQNKGRAPFLRISVPLHPCR
jgi:hypothetical protein